MGGNPYGGCVARNMLASKGIEYRAFGWNGRGFRRIAAAIGSLAFLGLCATGLGTGESSPAQAAPMCQDGVPAESNGQCAPPCRTAHPRDADRGCTAVPTPDDDWPLPVATDPYPILVGPTGPNTTPPTKTSQPTEPAKPTKPTGPTKPPTSGAPPTGTATPDGSKPEPESPHNEPGPATPATGEEPPHNASGQAATPAPGPAISAPAAPAPAPAAPAPALEAPAPAISAPVPAISMPSLTH